MISANPVCPSEVCLLADHLDTVLAVGEDLLALNLPPRADLDEHAPDAAPEAVDQFVRRLRQLEQSLIVRILQARNRLRELGRGDAPMRMTATLFRAQTDVLLDLVSATGTGLAGRFDGSADSFAYLRTRGLIAPEAAAPSPYESVSVTEALRIGGILELGPLLDLVSSLLDLLDARYGLYSPTLDELAAASVGDPVADTAALPEAAMPPDPIASPDLPASRADSSLSGTDDRAVEAAPGGLLSVTDATSPSADPLDAADEDSGGAAAAATEPVPGTTIVQPDVAEASRQPAADTDTDTQSNSAARDELKALLAATPAEPPAACRQEASKEAGSDAKSHRSLLSAIEEATKPA
ncbi:MAG: hypothetical protein SFW09_04915 [Hyphomicrobiaceae bacterium]|nr:hypothetical protein [Hyphomicrobiaceae bacterium]